MWHPWRRLRELPHVDLFWQDIDTEYGHTTFEPPAITITTGMTQAERRSTLTHELIHLERGSVGPKWIQREELVVRRLAAERLIPLEQLIDAMVWSLDEYEIAEECWVDVDTVRDRLAMLTADERRYVNAEMDRRGNA